MRRVFRWKILLALAAFIGGEVAFRLLGYRQYPVFVADARYEYLMAPDQDVHPGMIRFTTNELGLRCGPVGPKRGRRVLVFGDSVINGGYQTTQDSLATTVVQQRTGVQVLNCSAPSWGAGNAAAWLAAHGAQEADALVAVFSSHDAFDRMTFDPIVGRHPAYPDHKPLLAWSMFIDKLLFRFGSYTRPAKERLFDPGWRQLRDLSQEAGIPLVVVLHPERGEVKHQRYDPRGQELLDSLSAWKVPVVTMLDRMDGLMYTDAIHVNHAGQRAIAGALQEIANDNSGSVRR